MTSLLGRWKLIDARAFDEAGNELEPPLGHPMGVILYEADRMIVAVGNGRAMFRARPRSGPSSPILVAIPLMESCSRFASMVRPARPSRQIKSVEYASKGQTATWLFRSYLRGRARASNLLGNASTNPS